MKIGKVDSTSYDKLKRRLSKLLGMGTSDVQTPVELNPYGLDSNPVKGTRAVFAQTGIKGESVLLGYFGRDKKAAVGEIRLYSTDSDGNEQTFLWLKNDGTIEVAGNADNAVRYSELNNAKQQFVALLQTELGLIQAGIAGGSYTPTTLQFDISASKINEIKTP